MNRLNLSTDGKSFGGSLYPTHDDCALQEIAWVTGRDNGAGGSQYCCVPEAVANFDAEDWELMRRHSRDVANNGEVGSYLMQQEDGYWDVADAEVEQ